MQQTITDKIFNYKYLALAGAFFLLLVVVTNYLKTDRAPNEIISNDEIIYDFQANTEASVLIMEDTNEEDYNSDLYSNSFSFNHTLYAFLNNRWSIESSTYGFTRINSYFQSDLSPPLFM